jgi:hypothetical protein
MPAAQTSHSFLPSIYFIKIHFFDNIITLLLIYHNFILKAYYFTKLIRLHYYYQC